jgi:uncharacterized protein YegJ (DUF2314 family)
MAITATTAPNNDVYAVIKPVTNGQERHLRVEAWALDTGAVYGLVIAGNPGKLTNAENIAGFVGYKRQSS